MKRSFLITLVVLAVAIPAAALASGGEATRIALKPAKAFPAGKGSAKFKAKPGERELQVEVEHLRRLASRQVVFVVAGAKLGTAKVSARRGAAQPQQRAWPAGPAGEGGDRREGSHRGRKDRSLGFVLGAGQHPGRPGSVPAGPIPSLQKFLHW